MPNTACSRRPVVEHVHHSLVRMSDCSNAEVGQPLVRKHESDCVDVRFKVPLLTICYSSVIPSGLLIIPSEGLID
jgi:hypothetical protein